MDDEQALENPDLGLAFVAKQDLYNLSFSDLEERIENLNLEITRGTSVIGKRGNSKAAADEIFGKITKSD